MTFDKLTYKQITYELGHMYRCSASGNFTTGTFFVDVRNQIPHILSFDDEFWKHELCD